MGPSVTETSTDPGRRLAAPLKVAHVIHSLAPGGAQSVLAGVAGTAGMDVATRVGGIPDIIGDEAGLLAEVEPAAVARLLADPELRAEMGAAGRLRFLAGFEATGWAARLRTLDDTVLAEHAARRAQG